MAGDELDSFFEGLPIWGSLPVPPDIRSDRIRAILSASLTRPGTVSLADIRELAASVVHHLVTARCT